MPTTFRDRLILETHQNDEIAGLDIYQNDLRAESFVYAPEPLFERLKIFGNAYKMYAISMMNVYSDKRTILIIVKHTKIKEPGHSTAVQYSRHDIQQKILLLVFDAS